MLWFVALMPACEPEWTSFHLDQHLEAPVADEQRWRLTPTADAPGLIGVDCQNECDTVRLAHVDLGSGQVELGKQLKLAEGGSAKFWHHPRGGIVGVIDHRADRSEKTDNDDDSTQNTSDRRTASDEDEPELIEDLVHWDQSGQLLGVLASTSMKIEDVAFADDGAFYITGFDDRKHADSGDWKRFDQQLIAFDAQGQQRWVRNDKIETRYDDGHTCQLALHAKTGVVQACRQSAGQFRNGDGDFWETRILVVRFDHAGQEQWRKATEIGTEPTLTLHDLQLDDAGRSYVLWNAEDFSRARYYIAAGLMVHDVGGNLVREIDLDTWFLDDTMSLCVGPDQQLAVAGHNPTTGGQWAGDVRILAFNEHDAVDWSDAFGDGSRLARLQCTAEGPVLYGDIGRIYKEGVEYAMFATSFTW